MAAGFPHSPSSSPILEYVTSMRQQPSQMPTNSFSAVRFVENQRFIRLSLDLPGVLAEDLQIELQHGVLVIRGTRELRVTPGYCHRHNFCRRFAIDTDVVNIERFQANLNGGILTIMAPKMGSPKMVQIAVTQQDDSTFLASVAQSYQQQQQELASLTREEHQQNHTNAIANQENRDDNEREDETLAAATAVASLPTVVSMESASEVLENKAKTVVAVKRHNKSPMKSHLMIRRSMRFRTGRNTRNATKKR